MSDPWNESMAKYEYDTRAAAQKRLAEVRKVFPDAFVVCCRGTQIVK